MPQLKNLGDSALVTAASSYLEEKMLHTGFCPVLALLQAQLNVLHCLCMFQVSITHLPNAHLI